MREITKFVQQRGRLLSSLVRPLMWLAVFAAGFQNVFGVSIIPPYRTYIPYQGYIVPVLLGRGRRLFDSLGPGHTELELVRLLQAPDVTHLRYRIHHG